MALKDPPRDSHPSPALVKHPPLVFQLPSSEVAMVS